MMKLMVVGFYLLGVDATLSDVVGLDNTCTISGKRDGFRVIPRLYGWVYKTLILSPLLVEHSFVVMSARLIPMDSQFSISVLWHLCLESVVGITLWDPVEDCDTGGRNSITVKMEYLIFNTDIVNFVWKTNEGEAESIVLLIFVL